MQNYFSYKWLASVIFVRHGGCVQVCPIWSTGKTCQIWNNCALCEDGKVIFSRGKKRWATSHSASSMCTISLLFPFMSASCWRKRFGTCGNQGKIVFVWASGWISLLYQRVICLHWFKLFPLDVSSFTYMRDTHLVVYTQNTHAHFHQIPLPPHPHPAAPSALAVSLIYEVPLIWPKRLLRDLPPLSSLHLLHPSFSSSLSSVTRQSKSEGWYCTAGNT